jgi:hypothetical protein
VKATDGIPRSKVAATAARSTRRMSRKAAKVSVHIAEVEARIYPERAPLARVVLASGSFGYDPRDDADVVRIARLIADEPEVAP